jgi:hypothetical protein
MIRSVDEAPIWKPLPPATNAAVLRSGTITMQCGFSRTSCRMPLSCAAMISEIETIAPEE